MKKGDYIYTPRFCSCKIAEIYEDRDTARRDGFTEPTHYEGSEYDIKGKSTGINHMIFAAIKK
jgi:starvation-inducible outer membrane lipoprotein